MKFSKGKIRNVNKKILSGAIVLTIASTSLTGCNNKNRKINFGSGFKNDTSTVYYYGHIGYDRISKCRIIGIEVFDNTEFFFTYYVPNEGYYNIFGDEKIYNDPDNDNGNRTKVIDISAIDYLVYYNEVLSNYAPDDINRVLEKVKNDYTKENNKQLVKEK